MPPPADLAGRRFGRLLVLDRAPPLVSASGNSRRPAWQCRCDCGREEVLPQIRLPYCASNAARRDAATCCTHCRSRRVCVVCSRAFESLQYRATCSDECALLHRRALDIGAYFRKVEREPDHNKTRYRQRLNAAPDKMTAANQRGAERKKQRLAEDADYQAHVNKLARERYAARAADVQARKRERAAARLAAMSDDERRAHDEAVRAANTESARRRRATPEGAEANRQAAQRALSKRKLGQLAQSASELQKRIDS